MAKGLEILNQIGSLMSKGKKPAPEADPDHDGDAAAHAAMCPTCGQPMPEGSSDAPSESHVDSDKFKQLQGGMNKKLGHL